MCLYRLRPILSFPFFFFKDTAPPEISTLSLHDALPILLAALLDPLITWWGYAILQFILISEAWFVFGQTRPSIAEDEPGDRKSTRLNSSHANISYAVFCLKKKNRQNIHSTVQSHQIT